MTDVTVTSKLFMPLFSMALVEVISSPGVEKRSLRSGQLVLECNDLPEDMGQII